MSDKLNHSDLSSLLAKEAGISGAKAEAFTKAVFELVIEGLEQDGIVKINGLGTFKVTDVADRSSVNVNTGEKIEIKGHKKISFVPSDTLKETVNQPFAMFEPVEVDENYQDEDNVDKGNSVAEDFSAEETVEEVIEEAVENVVEPSQPNENIEEEMPAENIGYVEHSAPADILPEEYAPACEMVAESAVTNELPVKEGSLVEEDTLLEEPVEVEDATEALPVESVAECCEQEQLPEDASVVEDDSVAVNVVEEKKEEAPDESAENDSTAVEEKEVCEPAPEKERFEYYEYDEPSAVRKWLIRFLVLALFVAASYALYLLFTADKKSDYTGVVTPEVYIKDEKPANEENAIPLVPSQESIPVEESDDIPLVPLQESIPVEGNLVVVAELAARSDKSITDADTILYRITGEMAIHTVTDDDRLAKIANDYYGSRKFWPYIAKHNKLEKPYGLAVGMKLSIPELQPK